MISPSPLLPPSQQAEQEPKPEQKKVTSIPQRKRPGQSPTARFLKAIFRPIFKALYYLIRGIRNHKWLALVALLLFLGSATFVNYLVTKTLPFVGDDPVQGLTLRDKGSGDNVRNWLYALRDGDTAKMTQIQSGLVMQSPPDPTQLVGQYSKNHMAWQDISLLSVNTEQDTTLDAFVKVDVVARGQSGNVNAIMIWHFVTLPQQNGRVLFIEPVLIRPLVQ
jgi:hypothetical protein